jgi:hypothetical protein
MSEHEKKINAHLSYQAAKKINKFDKKSSGIPSQTRMADVLRAIMRVRVFNAHKEEMLNDNDMKALEGLTMDNAISIEDDDEDETTSDEENDDEDPVPKKSISKAAALETFFLMRENDSDGCYSCGTNLLDGPGDEVIGYMNDCFHPICTMCIDDFKIEMEQSKLGDTMFMTCPACESQVRTDLFELKRDEVEADLQIREAIRTNARFSKIRKYGGPHTKTKFLVDMLKEWDSWSAEHPEEKPVKTYANPTVDITHSANHVTVSSSVLGPSTSTSYRLPLMPTDLIMSE